MRLCVSQLLSLLLVAVATAIVQALPCDRNVPASSNVLVGLAEQLATCLTDPCVICLPSHVFTECLGYPLFPMTPSGGAVIIQGTGPSSTIIDCGYNDGPFLTTNFTESYNTSEAPPPLGEPQGSISFTLDGLTIRHVLNNAGGFVSINRPNSQLTLTNVTVLDCWTVDGCFSVVGDHSFVLTDGFSFTVSDNYIDISYSSSPAAIFMTNGTLIFKHSSILSTLFEPIAVGRQPSGPGGGDTGILCPECLFVSLEDSTFTSYNQSRVVIFANQPENYGMLNITRCKFLYRALVDVIEVDTHLKGVEFDGGLLFGGDLLSITASDHVIRSLTVTNCTMKDYYSCALRVGIVTYAVFDGLTVQLTNYTTGGGPTPNDNFIDVTMAPSTGHVSMTDSHFFNVESHWYTRILDMEHVSFRDLAQFQFFVDYQVFANDITVMGGASLFLSSAVEAFVSQWFLSDNAEINLDISYELEFTGGIFEDSSVELEGLFMTVSELSLTNSPTSLYGSYVTLRNSTWTGTSYVSVPNAQKSLISSVVAFNTSGSDSYALGVTGTELVAVTNSLFESCKDGGLSVSATVGYYGSRVWILRSIFSECESASGAGLIVSTVKPVVVEDCAFVGNSVSGNGGGAFIAYDETYVQFTNCIFEDNFAAGEGGALSADYSIPGRDHRTVSGRYEDVSPRGTVTTSATSSSTTSSTSSSTVTEFFSSETSDIPISFHPCWADPAYVYTTPPTTVTSTTSSTTSSSFPTTTTTTTTTTTSSSIPPSTEPPSSSSFSSMSNSSTSSSFTYPTTTTSSSTTSSSMPDTGSYDPNFTPQTDYGKIINGQSYSCFSPVFQMTSVTMRSNTAQSGGALYWSDGVGVLESSLVTGNTGYGLGGGIGISGGRLFVIDTTIEENSAVSGGAAHMLFGGDLYVRRSSVVRNSGGLVALLSTGSLSVALTTIAFNDGPAVDSLLTDLYLDSVVITGNYAPLSGAIVAVLVENFNMGDSFIFNNTGLGLSLTGTNVDDAYLGRGPSPVCSNSVGAVTCIDGRFRRNGEDLCAKGTILELDCRYQCANNETNPFAPGQVCVRDRGEYTGPYDGCASCMGACWNGPACTSPFAICTDSPDYTEALCSCPEGFTSSGSGLDLVCTDVDECLAVECVQGAVCYNFPGGFDCVCPTGLYLAGEACVDFDECGEERAVQGPCASHALCDNIYGSFSCECQNYYYGDGSEGPAGTGCQLCPEGSYAFAPYNTAVTDCQCQSSHYRVPAVGSNNVVSFTQPCVYNGCPPGYSTGTAQCNQCPPGEYGMDGWVCQACPPGTTTNYATELAINSSFCVCLPFHEPVGSDGSCERVCPLGTHQAGAETCLPCEADTYASSLNLPACSTCPPNSFTAPGLVGATSVDNCTCETDFVKSPDGQSCQLSCEPGRYAIAGVGCGDCLVGFYSVSGNETSCTACPTYSTTAGPRSTSLDDCVCLSGYARELPQGGWTGPLAALDCIIQCEPGTFRAAENLCLPCGNDTYSNTTNVDECTACPLNRVLRAANKTDLSQCTCLDGFVPDVPNWSGNSSSTLPPAYECERYCGPGTSIPSKDSLCVVCPVDTFTETAGEPSCTPCPFNTHTEGRSGCNSSLDCVCEDGFVYYNSGDRGDPCTLLCPPGSYLPAPDAAECVACAVNTYNDEVGAAACTPCPAFSTTNGATGAEDLTDCACLPDYHLLTDGGGYLCEACPTGATCSGGSSPPVAQPGFSEVDGTFVQCTPVSACAGGGLCAVGYQGELCAYCEAKFYRLDGECAPCQTSPGLVVAALTLLLFLFCFFLVLFNLQDRVINQFASVVIGLNSIQVMGMYGRLELEWPVFVTRFFSVLSFANFNIELVSPECAVPSSSPFTLRWLLFMCMPLIVALMMSVVWGVMYLWMSTLRTKTGATVAKYVGKAILDLTPLRLVYTCQRAFFQLLVIAYLPLSASVLEFFACTESSPGIFVVSSSPDMTCYDRRYWGLFPIALLCLLLYPIGIPGAYAAVLHFKRRELGEVGFALRYGFLVGRYKGELFFYELFVMGRKLLIVLCMSLVARQAEDRALATVLVLIMAVLLNTYFLPFRTEVYNAMESVCLVCSMIILVLTLMFDEVSNDNAAKNGVVLFVIILNLCAIAAGIGSDVIRLRNEDKEAEDVEDFAAHDIVGGGANSTSEVLLEEVASPSGPAFISTAVVSWSSDDGGGGGGAGSGVYFDSITSNGGGGGGSGGGSWGPGPTASWAASGSSGGGGGSGPAPVFVAPPPPLPAEPMGGSFLAPPPPPPLSEAQAASGSSASLGGASSTTGAFDSVLVPPPPPPPEGLTSLDSMVVSTSA